MTTKEIRAQSFPYISTPLRRRSSSSLDQQPRQILLFRPVVHLFRQSFVVLPGTCIDTSFQLILQPSLRNGSKDCVSRLSSAGVQRLRGRRVSTDCDTEDMSRDVLSIEVYRKRKKDKDRIIALASKATLYTIILLQRSYMQLHIICTLPASNQNLLIKSCCFHFAI